MMLWSNEKILEQLKFEIVWADMMLVQVSPGAMRCISVARASITNLLNSIECSEVLIWVICCEMY